MLYPRWINLFFLMGAAVLDPERLLLGKRAIVRSIPIEPAEQPDHERSGSTKFCRS